MDELRGFSKREAAAVKSTISRTHESFTPKYVEKRAEFGRTCILYGTSNELQIFDDDTGNRRFYVLETGADIDVNWVRDNHIQLWAQGVDMFKKDGVQWKKVAQLARSVIKKYEKAEDPWNDILEEYLSTLFVDSVTTNQLLGNALHIPEERRTKRESNRLGSSMRKLGWDYADIKVGGKVTKMWRKVNKDDLW
jgi:predicted P-loop ATPase